MNSAYKAGLCTLVSTAICLLSAWSPPIYGQTSKENSNTFSTEVNGARTLVLTGHSKAGLPVCTMHFAGKPFEMEVAATSAHRERGLGGRSQLLPNKGMLFVHPSAALRSYWMKDCLFDMDLAYLDARGKIIAMYTMKKEPPKRPGESLRNYKNRLKKYLSNSPAQYAIELQPGLMKKLGLRVGQVITLPHASLRGLTR